MKHVRCPECGVVISPEIVRLAEESWLPSGVPGTLLRGWRIWTLSRSLRHAGHLLVATLVVWRAQGQAGSGAATMDLFTLHVAAAALIEVVSAISLPLAAARLARGSPGQGGTRHDPRSSGEEAAARRSRQPVRTRVGPVAWLASLVLWIPVLTIAL